MKVLIVVLALVVSACSKDSPTNPSPAPVTPITFTFTGETTDPAGNTFWMRRSAERIAEGGVGVEIMGHFTSAFSKFSGTVLFDSTVLAANGYTTGDFMKQGGSLVDLTIYSSGNTRSMWIDRPDTLPGVAGDGVIIILWFKEVAGARGKDSPLQWDNPHAYTSGFSERLARTYGGTLGVR